MSSPLRSLLLGFGIEVSGKEKLDAVDGVVDGILKKVTKLGTGLASVFIVKEIAGFIKDTVSTAGALELTADKLGVTVDELERFRYAAGQSNIETEAADRALGMFNRQLGESEINAKTAAKGVGKVSDGFTSAQLAAMPLQEMLGHVADKFSAMTDKGQKTQLAMKLFGRQGAVLIPLLEQGAEGLKKFNEEFDSLGGGVGGGLAKKMKEAQQETKKLEFVWHVLSTRLVGDLLPAVNKFLMFLTKAAIGLEWLQKHTYIATTALIALGAAALVAFAPFLVGILPVVAAFTALYLIFDDIFTLFSGGDSVIGAFLNNMLGKDGASALIQRIKKDFFDLVDWLKGEGLEKAKSFGEALKEAFESVRPVLAGLLKDLNDVLDAIDFVTGNHHGKRTLAQIEQQKVLDEYNAQGEADAAANGNTSYVPVKAGDKGAPDQSTAFLAKALRRIAHGPARSSFLAEGADKLRKSREDAEKNETPDEYYSRKNEEAKMSVNIENLHVHGVPGSTGGVDDAISSQVESLQNSSPVTP